MTPKPQSGLDGANAPPKTVRFQCTKCQCQNEAPIESKELLFGGTSAGSATGRQPIAAVGRARSFIVRCSACKQPHRITVDVGDA